MQKDQICYCRMRRTEEASQQLKARWQFVKERVTIHEGKGQKATKYMVQEGIEPQSPISLVLSL